MSVTKQTFTFSRGAEASFKPGFRSYFDVRPDPVADLGGLGLELRSYDSVLHPERDADLTQVLGLEPQPRFAHTLSPLEADGANDLLRQLGVG